jgi:hypothetical protein
MLRWFGRHIRASNAVVAVTAAALLLCTATSFGLAATVFEHGLGLHHDHDLVGHHDHEHDAHHGHDNNTGDPPGGPDEIATHHVHVFALVQPVASLPWIPGRRLVREFAYPRLEQGCLHRLERIPKHLPA